MTDTLTQTTLSNGLRVLLKEVHTAPIISSWLWYRVGSRDEIQGRTGVSHWVEHMQFKGTEQFPANILDKAISREGGASARREPAVSTERVRLARGRAGEDKRQGGGAPWCQ